MLVPAGCGGPSDGRAVFARAEDGLARIRGGTIELHATVHALMPIERSAILRVDDVPLSSLDLTGWTKHLRRFACARSLECARADLDVEGALRDLHPLLPSLPIAILGRSAPPASTSRWQDVTVFRAGYASNGSSSPAGWFPKASPSTSSSS
jgi:hypothetical protein